MEEHQKENIWFILIIIILFIGVGTIYFSLQKDDQITDDVKSATKAVPDELRIPERAEIRYPVPAQETPEEKPAEQVVTEKAVIPVEPTPEPVVEAVKPPVPEKPETLQEALGKFFGKTFEELFIPENLVRHFVVTVDNLTARKLPQRFSFFHHPGGKFAVIKEPNDNKFLDPINYQRYAPFIKLAAKTDLDRLVDIYVRYYHLFQAAYEELGYPDRYFNDRLVEVIDHLLVTPKVTGKIALLQPKVFYQFANADLEALSAGQKILIRIGPANADVVKLRLSDLRVLLTNLKT